VLHVSALIGLIACGLISYTLLGSTTQLDDYDRYWLMTVGLGIMGGFQGVSITCIDTIFADSVKTGQRTKFNTFRFILTQISSMSGPLICVLLFLHYGNQWTRGRLTTVFATGIAITLVPIVVLFYVNDDHTLGQDSESHFIPSTPGGSVRYQRLVDDFDDACSSGGAAPSPYVQHRNRSHSADIVAPATDENFNTPPGSSHFDDSIAVSNTARNARGTTERRPVVWTPGSIRAGRLPPQRKFLCFGEEHITTVMIVSDIISALGSGMSVKFFPQFFKVQLGLSPVACNVVYIILPIFMALVSIGVKSITKTWGRIQVSLILSYLGCIGLFLLAYVGRTVEHNDWTLILPIYLLSTLQHCTRPLRKSVLMDYVPKSHRARFNSVDSVTRLNWSGSAILGGISIDRYGFGHLFVITAILQMVSASLLLLLLPIVPIHETVRRNSADFDEESDDDTNSGEY